MGWNGSDGAVVKTTEKAPAAKPSTSWVKGAAAGAIIVVVAGLALFFIMGKSPAPKKAPKKAPAKVTQTAPEAPKSAPKTAAPEAENKKQSAAKKPAPGGKMNTDPKFAKSVSSITNFGRVITTYRNEDGSLFERSVDIVEPIAKNGTDQILLMAAETVPGEDAPPMPDQTGADKEFLKTLKEPIVIEEGDSEQVRKIKETINDMRQQMIELTKNGKTFEEIIEEHQDMLKSNAEMRQDAMTLLNELIAEGSMEEAKLYVEKVNQVLEKSGIKTIEMPLTREERIQRALERKNNKKQ